MAETGPPPEPKTIPPQADFPVEWESPDEQKIPWQLDKMHFPEAMPPLESEFWIRFMHGMHLGMEHYEMPMQVAGKEFNYWVYLAIFPRVPPEQMEERGKHSDQNVMDTGKTLEVNRGLWDLSRKARASDAVRAIFEERAASDVVEALAATDDGRARAKELDVS